MKRPLCILTAAALAFIPLPVSAEETYTPQVYTGQCGEDITWELKNHILTLSGNLYTGFGRSRICFSVLNMGYV